MTRTEIEKQALSLPVSERVALAQTLLKSLKAEDQDAVRAHLGDDLSAVELVALGDRLDAEMRAWFDPTRGRAELTDDDWEQMMHGEYRHAPDPESLATPPGWQSPRPKQQP